jgi:hypothetical protein
VLAVTGLLAYIGNFAWMESASPFGIPNNAVREDLRAPVNITIAHGDKTTRAICVPSGITWIIVASPTLELIRFCVRWCETVSRFWRRHYFNYASLVGCGSTAGAFRPAVYEDVVGDRSASILDGHLDYDFREAWIKFPRRKLNYMLLDDYVSARNLLSLQKLAMGIASIYAHGDESSEVNYKCPKFPPLPKLLLFIFGISTSGWGLWIIRVSDQESTAVAIIALIAIPLGVIIMMSGYDGILTWEMAR